MTKPTRYFIEYVTRWDEDNPPETAMIDADTLVDALLIYAGRRKQMPQLRERKDIHDITPAGDPRGLLWDFEEEIVEDCP